MSAQDDLEGLWELLAKATPGPWVAPAPSTIEVDGVPRVVVLMMMTPADAALIVAAVNALPALLDELERLRSVRDGGISEGAAARRLYVLTRLVTIAHDEMPERLNNATRVNVNHAHAYARGVYSSGDTRDLEAEYDRLAALGANAAESVPGEGERCPDNMINCNGYGYHVGTGSKMACYPAHPALPGDRDVQEAEPFPDLDGFDKGYKAGWTDGRAEHVGAESVPADLARMEARANAMPFVHLAGGDHSKCPICGEAESVPGEGETDG